MIITFVNLVSAKQVKEKSAILIRFVGGLSPKCCSCEYVNMWIYKSIQFASQVYNIQEIRKEWWENYFASPCQIKFSEASRADLRSHGKEQLAVIQKVSHAELYSIIGRGVRTSFIQTTGMAHVHTKFSKRLNKENCEIHKTFNV